MLHGIIGILAVRSATSVVVAGRLAAVKANSSSSSSFSYGQSPRGRWSGGATTTPIRDPTTLGNGFDAVHIDLPSSTWNFGQMLLFVLIHGTRAAIQMLQCRRARGSNSTVRFRRLGGGIPFFQGNGITKNVDWRGGDHVGSNDVYTHRSKHGVDTKLENL